MAKKIADKHHNHLPVVDADGPPGRAWSRGPTRSPRSSTTSSRWSGRSPGSTSARSRQLRAAEGGAAATGAELCAVVKADGYGHGADGCADAALAGGATRLAVATAAEAEQVGRRFQHVPLLTMGALTAEEVDVVARRRLGGGGLARGLPRACSPTAPAPRAARPASTSSTTAAWAGSATPTPPRCWRWPAPAPPTRSLELAGVWTHFATADEPDSGFFDEQLDRFDAVAAAVKAEFPAVDRPRRQQRRRLPRPPLALRHGPLRRRHLRARPVPGRPGRARPGARRSRCAPTSPT